MISFPNAWKYEVTYSTSEDVDEKFDKLEKKGWEISKIRENVKSLISKNDILPETLDNILPLNALCNYNEYRKFLARRDDFLRNHQVMSANQFSQLFWNEILKNKKIENNKDLISGKYNKADINQGKLWICVFDTFLKQFKETPFFETMIRCSLQRNESNDWWKCLIPLCNNEWKYEEISDDDIDYLKNSKIWNKKLISDTSLWFNILETLLVKMIWNRKKYPNLAFGHWRLQLAENTISYHDLKTVTQDDLHDSAYWINIKKAHDYFLWKDVVEQSYPIYNFDDEELKWLVNLTKTWIIKLRLGVKNSYRDNIKKFVPPKKNRSVRNNGLDGETNERILDERWYTLKVLHKSSSDDEISVWNAKDLWIVFKIEWTNEWFVSDHAYSIEGMHKKNGKTFITIINPRYTWKKIDVPLKYVKEFFYIWVDWFDINKMFVENEEANKEKNNYKS